jgi:hypothetical protein
VSRAPPPKRAVVLAMSSSTGARRGEYDRKLLKLTVLRPEPLFGIGDYGRMMACSE